MKTLSVTEVARNFRKVLDAVEHRQEEIILVRNRRQVARLVPETPNQNALEVFGDLYRTLDEKSADAFCRRVCPPHEPSGPSLGIEEPLASRC
jgi:antitoxin (DNA-binding transcriptional repressor) of toxin-antitoxin stability system